MGSNEPPQVVPGKDLKMAINDVKNQVRMHVILGEKWRDFGKPLGARKPPGIPPLPGAPPIGLAAKGINMLAGRAGHAFGIQGGKGRALRANAGIAGTVQNKIVELVRTIHKLPEPQRSINLSYLQHIADATVVAARACQVLCMGKSPAKDVTRLAASWVVTLGCSATGLPVKKNMPAAALDQRVKDAAIMSYPLFSAGRKLNETLNQAQALHIAFAALDVA